MSSCDCDRKSSNGGTCDCEEETFGFVENTSSSMTFAPVLAASKAAGAVEVVVSFAGRADEA